MRTKTLFLTALMGVASMATVFAQSSNVYSVNVVGYVTKQVNAGFNLIGNPLVQDTPTLDALIPNPPPATTVYTYTPGSGYQIYTFDDLDLAWLPTGQVDLNLGDGFFIFAPAAFEITFVGEVAQSVNGAPLVNDAPVGFSIKASPVPQEAAVSTLGLDGQPADTIYRYVNDGSSEGYQIYTFDDLDLAWLPEEPTMGVGEAWFMFSAAGTPFQRVFTVE